MSNIGPKIASLRERYELTQSELEQLTGIHRTTIAKIETGQHVNLTVSSLQRLATALHTTVSELTR
jgi:transcriptional regulator with XRE-family HTH domain